MTHPGNAYPSSPPPPPRRSDATIVLRVLATPITWLAAALLLCVSAIPAAIVGDDHHSLANWLPVAVFAALLPATLVVLRRWISPTAWVPIDAPAWLLVIVVLIPIGEELDLGGGAALALTLLGLALAIAFTVRLVVFHVRQYRAGR